MPNWVKKNESDLAFDEKKLHVSIETAQLFMFTLPL